MTFSTDGWVYEKKLSSECPQVANQLHKRLVREIESTFNGEGRLWEPILVKELEKLLWKLATALADINAQSLDRTPLRTALVEAELNKVCEWQGQGYQYLSLALYVACGWREKVGGSAYFCHSTQAAAIAGVDDGEYSADAVNVSRLEVLVGHPPEPTFEMLVFGELVRDEDGVWPRKLYRKRRKIMLQVMKGFAPKNNAGYFHWGWTVGRNVVRAIEECAPEYVLAAIGELALARANGIAVIR